MKPLTAPSYARKAVDKPYALCMSARRKPKIKMVQRPEVSLSRRTHIIDACFEALKTMPTNRTSYQIDSIMAVLMKWNVFNSLGNSDFEYRQICKNLNLLFLDKNSLLFRKGDPHDLMYIVYSGKVKLYGEIEQNNFQRPVSISKQYEPTKNESDSIPIDINININECRPESNASISSRSSRLPLLCHHEAPTSISSARISRRMEPISQEVLSLLQTQIGRNNQYELLDVKEEKDEIGQKDFGKDDSFQYTAVATEPTYVIFLDLKVYRMILKFSKEKIMKERSDFLMNVPELDPIKEYPNSKQLFYRLSEVMTEMTIPKGSKLKSFCNGWMIIRDGCLIQSRFVDFQQSKMDFRSIEDDQIGFNLKLPEGNQNIQTGEFICNHCVADPSLSNKLNKPFTLSSIKDTQVFVINIDDIHSLIPIDIRKEIEKIILDDPSDDSLIRNWYEKEKQIKWEMYRKSCKKEASQYMKQERVDDNRTFACRIPKPPKSIKAYQRRQINQRLLASRNIKSKVTFS